MAQRTAASSVLAFVPVPPGLGILTCRHALPFQCSAWLRPALPLPSCTPTAQQLARDVQYTPTRKPKPAACGRASPPGHRAPGTVRRLDPACAAWCVLAVLLACAALSSPLAVQILVLAMAPLISMTTGHAGLRLTRIPTSG